MFFLGYFFCLDSIDRGQRTPIRAHCRLMNQAVLWLSRADTMTASSTPSCGHRDRSYFFSWFLSLDRQSRQTWYMCRFLPRSKALGGKDLPQRPLQIRSVPQSSHTYTLFSFTTRSNIFVLFLPHFVQVGNWHSRQTLCTFLLSFRPNADSGKAFKHPVHCRLAASPFWHAGHMYT